MKLLNTTFFAIGLGALLTVACNSDDGDNADNSDDETSSTGGTNVAAGGSGGVANSSGGAANGATNSGGASEDGTGGAEEDPGEIGGAGGESADTSECDQVDDACCSTGMGGPGANTCGGGLVCQFQGGGMSTCQEEEVVDTTDCAAVGDPCCPADRGPGTCAEGLTCDGFGADAVCAEAVEVDTTECDQVDDVCCSTGGQGPGSNTCGGGLICQFAGQGADPTCQEEG